MNLVRKLIIIISLFIIAVVVLSSPSSVMKWRVFWILTRVFAIASICTALVLLAGFKKRKRKKEEAQGEKE